VGRHVVATHLHRPDTENLLTISVDTRRIGQGKVARKEGTGCKGYGIE